MFWFDSQPNNHWDWNCDAMSALDTFNLETSKLPVLPGLPLTNRFQELESDDEAEDEKFLSVLESDDGPRVSCDRQETSKCVARGDIPKARVNQLIAEPTE